MNKKLLVAGAVTIALVLSACVKKEAPKEEEQEQTVENTQQQPTALDSVELAEPVEAETTQPPVSIEHQETNNTTATIQREYRDTPTESPTTPAPKPEAVKPAVEKPAVEKPAPQAQNTSSSSQTEDDAVAAAIAAATPALEN